MRLVERWQNDIVADLIAEILSGCVPDELLAGMKEERHWCSLGGAPAYHLGSILIEAEASPATPIIQRVRAAASKWSAARRRNSGMEVDRLVGAVAGALAGVEGSMAPALHTLVAAEALGEAFFDVFPDRAERLEKNLCAADRHVWTPHSLSALKEENFRDRSEEVVRALKFCERRDHERAVCDRTKAFAATSTEIAERLRTAYDVPSEQIFYFPPCVDRSVFRKYSDKETEPAYRYLSEISGIGVEKLRASKIVFETSRMDQTKRKGLLLDAFAFVARERRDAYLFIGGGPENAVFKSLEERLGQKPELHGRAFLCGFIPDEYIGPLFSMADVYASASEMEGFGMSVLQAAASTTAVVCSDLVPFAVQYVPEDALIVPAGEVFDFAQAIGNLLDSEPDRSRRALQLAEKVKVLDWEAQAVAFLQYLRRRGFSVAPGKEGA
jgi:glycosyltransferase involved in cell wall biosynthesis